MLPKCFPSFVAFVLLSLLYGAPTISAACTCTDDWLNYCSAEVMTDETVTVYCVPDGSGNPLSAAQSWGGLVVDATIQVQLIDAWTGDPCADVPAEDIWFECAGDCQLTFCSGPPIADGPTNEFGQTTFSGPVAAGGHSTPDETEFVVMFSGSALFAIPIWSGNLQFNSADINGDGVVNLADVGIFAGDYFGDHHFRSDFYWDGTLNLSDLARLAEAMGRECAE